MATLAQIRAALNGELGVVTDAETSPWSVAVRNQAISDGYAELWRVGVWKPVSQTVATVDAQGVYALTSIRRLERAEMLDSTSGVIDELRSIVEEDGAGANQLRLSRGTLPTGYNIRVRGWTAYVSTFASDSASDDLPAEHARIPRLKAKAILYRAQLGSFVRFQQSQALPKSMQVSPEVLLGIISAAEAEFAAAARVLSGLRPRAGQLKRL